MLVEYVLVTPARNEEAQIERTIRSVIAQTIRPMKWVIVSDGSTDGTDDIVQDFARAHSFIELVHQLQSAQRRSFGSKAEAFNIGYQQLLSTPHSYIGNLDADVTLPIDYYQTLFRRFAADTQLGIGGGLVYELVNGKYIPQRSSSSSVAGAVQVFRRECFEQIGGYVPLRFGGIDAAAEITARMAGWRVQAFPELEVRHRRPVASGEGAVLRTKWSHGLRHYSLGYHPMFELLRNGSLLFERPRMLGTFLMTGGYFWGLLTGMRREMPDEVVHFLQSEQMGRIRAALFTRKRTSGTA